MAAEAKPSVFQRLDALYEFDRQPVAEDKLQPGGYFAGVFSGEHIAATEFVIGALFVSLGATAYDVLVGLLVGNFLAVLSWTLVCAPIAVQTRLTLYWYLRKIAGPAVTVLYNVLNAVLFCILAGAMITVSASALRIPFGIKPQTQWLPDDPWFIPLVLVVGAVVVTLATWGFKRLAQFSSICSPWMVAMFLAGALIMLPYLGPVGSWESLYRVAREEVWKGPAEGQAQLGFWHVAAFAWICNLAMHLGLSDMAMFRYARRASYGLYSAFGMFLGHYLAWVCAGIMGAATVLMVNYERVEGGPPRPGLPLTGMRAAVSAAAKRAAQTPDEGPTLAPPKPKAKTGLKGISRPAKPRSAPAPGSTDDAAPPNAAKKDVAQAPLTPVPASAEAGRERPPSTRAPESDDDEDQPGRSIPPEELAKLEDVDAGEVAFRSLGVVGVLVVVLAGWTTANPTLYRAGLALQAVTPGWPRWVVTVLAGALTTLVACSPFVFRQLLSFVAIYGILLVPVGAIVVAEHWLFPLLGLTRFWSARKRQALNWPALASWMAGLAIAAAAWIAKYVYDRAIYVGDFDVLHEYFLVVPVWIAVTVLYVVLAALAGAREKLPELAEEPAPGMPPAVRENVAGAVRLSVVERRVMLAAAVLAAVSLAYWLGSLTYAYFTREARYYGDVQSPLDELGYQHLAFLIGAVVFFHLWEKSLPWNRTLYLASGLMALACLAACVWYGYCVYSHAMDPDPARSRLIPVTLGYFAAALLWVRQRKKRDEG